MARRAGLPYMSPNVIAVGACLCGGSEIQLHLDQLLDTMGAIASCPASHVVYSSHTPLQTRGDAAAEHTLVLFNPDLSPCLILLSG